VFFLRAVFGKAAEKAQNENVAGADSLRARPRAVARLPGCSCAFPSTLHRAEAHAPAAFPTWDVGVTEAAWDSPLIHLQLQGIDFIYVTRYPASRGTAEAL